MSFFKRKTFIPVCCFLMGGISSMSLNAQSTLSKPNIVFILTDDLGYGDIGVFFQNARNQSGDRSRPSALTPRIDQLAKSGAQLTQQYCNAPVCAPSRASLLTGVNQGNARIRDNQFDKALENNHTIATVLKTAGYATLAIGKWGLQGEKEEAPYWPSHPLKRGFDHYFGYMRHADGHEHYPAEGVYRGKKEVWEDYQNVAAGLNKCYTTDLWTAKAKQWITDHERERPSQPFFLYLAYDAPHAVLELPAQPYPPGGGLNGGLRWLGEPGHMINTASGTADSYLYPEYANATWDSDHDPSTAEVPWPDTYKRYATATKRIDDAVGDLMQLLRDLKIDNNTLVVFTSDNGPSIESYLPTSYVPNHPTFFDSYGPFDGIKRDCWEGGIRMPTLVSWGNHIKGGTIVNEPSMLSDWLATFADAAHLPPPARTDGVSLLPSLTGKAKGEPSLIYVEYSEGGRTPDFTQFEASRRGKQRNQMQMIRTGNLVGVRYDIKSAGDDFEIYDVLKDPKQKENLALRPSFAKIQQGMKARVLQLRQVDAGARRPYDDAEIPSSAFSGKGARKGWRWTFFGGAFPYVVSPKELKPQSSGTARSIQMAAGSAEGGLFLYEAFLLVPGDGKYDFSFSTSGKAFLRLHEAGMFDADFGYGGDTLQKSLYLKKGYHPLTLYLLKEQGRQESVRFEWKKSGDPQWKRVEETVFYQSSKTKK